MMDDPYGNKIIDFVYTDNPEAYMPQTAQLPWTLVIVPWTGHASRPHKLYANGDKLPASAEDIEVWKAIEQMRLENCQLQARVDQLESENAELKEDVKEANINPDPLTPEARARHDAEYREEMERIRNTPPETKKEQTKPEPIVHGAAEKKKK